MDLKKLWIKILPYLLVGIGFCLFFTMMNQHEEDIHDTRAVSIENNTYHRIVACLLSVQPDERTPEHVKHCYDQAEAHNNVKVMRFGHAIETE